jgi:hypothetical protein
MEESGIRAKRNSLYGLIVTGLTREPEAKSKTNFVHCGECGIAMVWLYQNQWRIKWIELRKIEEFI